jgi:hypothetical protein
MMLSTGATVLFAGRGDQLTSIKAINLKRASGAGRTEIRRH